MRRFIGVQYFLFLVLATPTVVVAEVDVLEAGSCPTEGGGESCQVSGTARRAEADAMQNYLPWEGDCPGKRTNLCNHEDVRLEECARKCSAHRACLGFSYNPKRHSCFLKGQVAALCIFAPLKLSSPYRFFQRLFIPREVPPPEVRPEVPECARIVLDSYQPPLAAVRELPALGGVFIVHWPPLTERREHLETGLQKAGLLPATWVTWLNKEDIADLPKHCLYDAAYDRFFTPGTKSVNLKHIWIYYWMWKKGLDNVVVLEDDADLTRSYIKELQELSLSLPQGYTSISLGGLYGIKQLRHHEKLQRSARLFGPGLPTRTNLGYMISAYGAALVLQHVFSESKPPCSPGAPGFGVNAAADHLMDHVLLEGSYWYEPTLFHVSRLFEQHSHFKEILKKKTA